MLVHAVAWHAAACHHPRQQKSGRGVCSLSYGKKEFHQLLRAVIDAYLARNKWRRWRFFCKPVRYEPA